METSLTGRRVYRQRSEMLSAPGVWRPPLCFAWLHQQTTTQSRPHTSLSTPHLLLLFLLRLPCCCLCLQKQNTSARQSSGMDGDIGRGWGGGIVLREYAHSDTFSLFLLFHPVLIISIFESGDWPNIEPVLIDQPSINKLQRGWQHVIRGRSQIGCTD